MFEFQGDIADRSPAVRRMLRTPFIHWKQGTDRFKLTTPLDLWKRRMVRYAVASGAENWPGGVVPTFATRRRAEKTARAISTWGFPVRAIRWHKSRSRKLWEQRFENGHPA